MCVCMYIKHVLSLLRYKTKETICFSQNYISIHVGAILASALTAMSCFVLNGCNLVYFNMVNSLLSALVVVFLVPNTASIVALNFFKLKKSIDVILALLTSDALLLPSLCFSTVFNDKKTDLNKVDVNGKTMKWICLKILI